MITGLTLTNMFTLIATEFVICLGSKNIVSEQQAGQR